MREGDTLYHTARLAADFFLWHQKQLVGNFPCQDLAAGRKTHGREYGVGIWLKEEQTSLLLWLGSLWHYTCFLWAEWLTAALGTCLCINLVQTNPLLALGGPAQLAASEGP